MKKTRNFIILFLSVLLFLSTFNFSTWKVSAQDDVTKVNHFYSADEVVSGTTTPNTRVKYVGKNYYDERYGVFSAVSNKDGIFKIYVGKHQANTTFTINTYDPNGNLIDSDEVFVLKASLEAYFSISFGSKMMIDDQGEVGQTPIKRPMTGIYYKASQGSKIEVIVDDKIVKNVFAGGSYSSLECPEIHLGDFVKIRVSKGKVIKTYELLATSYDIYDWFMVDYPISTSKITTWSDSISVYLPPNLKYSGLFNKNKDVLSTGATGVIKQSFDENTTLKDLKPLTLYEEEFENVISVETLRLTTSPKPEIDPVSQISNEVTGTATANSLITVLDEENTKLGESTTNENGRFGVPVDGLDPDTIIKVETRMPNTNQYDYSYTSVEEVHIEELSDNNAYITGQSSFGNEAEVYLLESNPIPNNSMKKSFSSNGLTTTGEIKTNSKKSIGKFTLNNDSMFKLNIGKQKANSIVQVVLNENGKSLSLPSKTVKDKTAPVISGTTKKSIPINSTFNAKTSVTAKDNVDSDLTSAIKVTGTVNTKKIGTYDLSYAVADKSGNGAKITRKITVYDNVKPVILGATNKTVRLNSSFNPKTSVTAKDNVDGSLTSKIKVSGTVNTKKKGTYTLKYTVTDNSKNVTTITRKITIDSTKPVISGAKSKTIELHSSFSSKKGVTAKDNLDGNLTNKINVTGSVNTKKKGTFTLTYSVTDKSKNKTEVKRKITVK
ncbi:MULTISPECIES: immunoglobulin-like domain-containing protein [unclassified Bacillus (in: firmicutes)]|uniref:immunoglobulin-like domain-containing protein n=1 Tax=unclassified Bacillus (in: firmicutes) TaxID=185979 RepID=UPI001BECD218|nr:MULTISPECIES: immunoglobulin-like domain-containing protein [unclassified Bacillus (in: firmicutes)]MBT2617410.1 DUF5011 domain-containing protein [Bacillus sp. ISL-78]MBT2630898.1 DUF5011 domain-containing protein [Bacillus sp. ISL-101]